ncbi:hypothetical protein ACODT3_00125 [Streptomyces sp. 4.24]|uniref:hypothetical protein n=1 Tax=Streptomyces tritrimontium TaxID=3406573 RepID=UPI003BB55BDF
MPGSVYSTPFERDQRTRRAFRSPAPAAAPPAPAAARPLPLSSQVRSLYVDTELFTQVYEKLPTALRTPETYDLLEQVLSGEHLIARGTSFIGRSAKLLAHLRGSSATWAYSCRVWISLQPEGDPAGPVALPNASISTAHKAAGSLADSTTLTTGPTISATGSAGTAMGPHLLGGNVATGVTYRREKARNHTSNLGHERSDTLSYGEGAVQFGNRARVRIRIEWDKKRNALAMWARGTPHKEHAVSPGGTSYAELEYVLPSALIPPRTTDAGTSTGTGTSTGRRVGGWTRNTPVYEV